MKLNKMILICIKKIAKHRKRIPFEVRVQNNDIKTINKI